MGKLFDILDPIFYASVMCAGPYCTSCSNHTFRVILNMFFLDKLNIFYLEPVLLNGVYVGSFLLKKLVYFVQCSALLFKKCLCSISPDLTMFMTLLTYCLVLISHSGPMSDPQVSSQVSTYKSFLLGRC